MKEGVKIYGGFPATGTPGMDDRNWEANETVLKGNGNSVVRNDDNGLTAASVLDGFTITGGKASAGGGISNTGVSPTFRNLTIAGNTAEGRGGGVHHAGIGSKLTMYNVRIVSNTATGSGGGIFSDVDLALIHAVISDNSGNNGGGVESGGTVTLTDVQLSGNTARGNIAGGGKGGGIFIKSIANLTNVTITGNKGVNGGGISNSTAAALTVVNCSISGNTVSEQGGGIYQTGNAQATLVNCIVWNNRAASATTTASASVYNDGSSKLTSAYSLVANSKDANGDWLTAIGTDGGGNIDADPVFVTAINPAEAPTVDGDFQLQPISPAINWGNNTAYTAEGGDLELDTDLAGNPRVYAFPGVIDMGAYEYQGDVEPMITPNANAVLYVWKEATGNGSGNSWENAIPELADALKWAKMQEAANANWLSGKTLKIYVAIGTYKPMYSPADGTNFGTDQGRDNSFALVKDVQLYGGFDPGRGIVSLDNERILPGSSHDLVSILSGDFDDNDVISGSGKSLSITNNGDNASHVVIA